MLVSHGIFHGCDGGLLAVRDVVEGRRVIVPSRFGYLGSTLPHGASSATQADAFAGLLDHLAIEQVDVVGISAGTGAALQLAMRHPDRIGHLVISSGESARQPDRDRTAGLGEAVLQRPGNVDAQSGEPSDDQSTDGCARRVPAER